ncbi:MAG: methyltransferase [Candidatus Lokiarchaeota archaeon]|nr:methyltransferase [Candidatus Lokiarchaeota archaeon]MBD3198710.1 methyltransferase [Candidatus Lokiarchaeota archaeon]
MNEKLITHIKIHKKDGQRFIKLLKHHCKNQTCIDNRFRIKKRDKFLLFPLVSENFNSQQIIDLLKNKFSFDLVYEKGLINHNYQPKNLEELLENKLSNKEVSMIPHSYDIIGNIAILELNHYDKFQNSDIIKETIAEGIIKINQNVESVFEKKSEIKGTYRLRSIEHLAGVRKTSTIHKENGCIYKIDIKKSFFTPRLVYERKRLSSLEYKKNEIIVDLFAGVGSFSIQIAKEHPVDIYALDINPDAYDLLKHNISINNLKGNILPINDDAKLFATNEHRIGKELKGNVNRLIMNLPEKSLEFIDTAAFLLTKKSKIHLYQFSEKPNSIKKSIEMLKRKLEFFDLSLRKVFGSRIVKSYSPQADLVVIDALIEKI